MIYNQVAIFFLQGTLVAFVILILFRLRKVLGIGALFACLGLFKFIQIFLSHSSYSFVNSNILIAPGASIFITATFFALLVIYIKEDATETKKIVIGLLIVDLLITFLLEVFGWNTNTTSSPNDSFPLKKSLSVIFIGNITLLIDALIIITTFEFLSKKIKYLFFQICITMLIVATFDTFFFSLLSFWKSENLYTIISMGLISKGSFTIYYSIIFFFYLKYFEQNNTLFTKIKFKDTFNLLTYKQKFEHAKQNIKNTEKMFRLITNHSNDIICLQDPDSTFRYISPSIKNILGYKQHQFLGKKIYSIVHEDDLEELKSLIEAKEFSTKLIRNVYLFRFKHINGKYIWLEFLTSPVFNGKQISYFVTTARDVSNRVLADNELKKSLNLLTKREHNLNEASKVGKIGFIQYDNASKTYIWSDYVYTIFGIKLNEEIPEQREFLAFFKKESQIKIRRVIKENIQNGISCDIEVKAYDNNKEEIWLRVILHPIFNSKKEVIGRRGIIQDITHFKATELRLENSKLKIQNSLDLLAIKERSLNEASEIGKIGLIDYNNETGTYTWSDNTYKIFGFNQNNGAPSLQEMIALFDKKSKKKLIKTIDDINLKELSNDIELKLINKKNKEIWIRHISKPIYSDNNNLCGRRVLVQDITDFKKTQFKLEKSKQDIQNSLHLLENKEHSLNEASKMGKIGYLEDDVATDTFIWSEYLYNIFGFDASKPVPSRQEIALLFDEDSQEKMRMATLNLDTKGIPFDIVLKFINLRNEEGWIRIVVKPVYNNENKIVKRRGLVQDITDYKLAQFKLEKSKEEIQNTLNLLEKKDFSLHQSSKVAKIGFWEYNIANDSFIFSDYVYKIFGFDLNDKILSKDKMRAFYDAQSQKKLELATKKIDETGVPYDIELRLINLKNEEVWVRNVVQLIYDKENNIIGRKGVIQNITERKKIEQEHLRIKNNYQRLFDNASISIWNEDFTLLYNQLEKLKKNKISNIKIHLKQNPLILQSLIEKIKINSVNKASLKLFKAKSHESFFNNIERTFGNGADEVVLNLIEAIWNNESLFSSEVNYKTFRGDEFAAIVSIPIPKTLEEQKTVPVIIQSIQSIKDAQTAMEESLYNLNRSQKLVHLGNWGYDPIDKKSEWSEEVFNIWEFDSEFGTPNYENIISRIHPNDLELFEKSLNDAIELAKPYDIEFRITTPNKKEKVLRAICEPIKDNHGKVINLKGINHDITENKKAKLKIEKAEEMYRVLTDYSNDLICLQEPDSTFKYISPSIKPLLGYNQSEFLGKQVFSIVHKNDIAPLREAMEKKIFNTNVGVFSFRVRHKKGHYIWLEFLSSPVYKNEELSYYVTSARDITQRVLSKKEIDEYQKSLQSLTTEITLIEENQKKEIATNIHDHLSQSLVISKMKINELKKSKQLNDYGEDLSFIDKHISEALTNSRKITYELSPPVLYQLGIIEAINWLVEEIENTHKISFVINDNIEEVELSDIKSILLFRSIQEVLNNAIKYSKATLITLNLNINKLGLDICILDNGVGFDTSILNNFHNHKGNGFGLFTVKERIKNIKGNFMITSKINKGTTVNIFIPLKK